MSHMMCADIMLNHVILQLTSSRDVTDLTPKLIKMKFLALLLLTFVAAIGRNALRRKVVMKKLCNVRTCGMCGEVLYAGARLFAEPTKRAQNLCFVLRSFQGCCNK